MKGYIGLTDRDWFSFLQRRPRVDEVNFWQPHGSRAFRALQRGEPFFFKLRAPYKAIAGFGFFERYESLPAWLAWECFSEMNGAGDFDAMVDRICRLRGDAGPAYRAGYTAYAWETLASDEAVSDEFDSDGVVIAIERNAELDFPDGCTNDQSVLGMTE